MVCGAVVIAEYVKETLKTSCGGLLGRCGVQDSAVHDRDLVVRGRDSPWLAKTWPRLHQNKALEARLIMVIAAFSGGMGNQGSQALHGFFAPEGWSRGPGATGRLSQVRHKRALKPRVS